MLNVYNLRYKIGCVVSGIYFHLCVIAIVIIVLLSFIQFEDGFKEAQAHSLTVPVRGLLPYGVTYNSANNDMYVANHGSSTVSVMSDTTDSVIASILVGRGPAFIAYAPPNNKLYVSNAVSNDTYVINGATNKVIKDIPVDNFPIGIAYNPSNDDVYVVNFMNDTISVIDTSLDSVIDTIFLDSIVFDFPFYDLGPFSITYDRINSGMYVGANRSPQVSVVNTASNAGVKDLRMPTSVADSRAGVLAHNPNDNRIYVAAHDSNAVVRFNPETNEFEGSPILVGEGPIGVVHNPRNNNIYVTNFFSNTVSVINPTTSSVIDTIPTGTNPAGIAYNPSNNHIYVANAGSNTVSIIHP